MSREGRATNILADALAQFRAVGVVDPITRDLLLQVLGAIDSATATIDDATEIIEAVIGLVPEADASDLLEVLDCAEMDMSTPMRSRKWLDIQRAALDL